MKNKKVGIYLLAAALLITGFDLCGMSMMYSGMYFRSSHFWMFSASDSNEQRIPFRPKTRRNKKNKNSPLKKLKDLWKDCFQSSEDNEQQKSAETLVEGDMKSPFFLSSEGDEKEA